MIADPTDRYRPLFRENPPDFYDRVDSPWEAVPDHEEYNKPAYVKIEQTLNRLVNFKKKSQSPPSQGVLILGEPGSGKTHLLMRVARTLSRRCHILAVKSPANAYDIHQHVWSEMILSLTRKLPGRGYSQLDDLLSHVFCNILIPLFRRDIEAGRDAVNRARWVELLERDPYNLAQGLGRGASRQRTINAIKRITVQHLQTERARVMNDTFVGALMSYYFAGPDEKGEVLDWFLGNELDEDVAKRLGLPPSWTTAPQVARDDDARRYAETQALKAIVTVATLSIYYQPLILAFDQLESLRDKPDLTKAWGDCVREIFSQAPNMLIVTCIFPTLWEQWFQPRFQKDSALQSVVDRIAPPAATVTLQEFTGEQAVALLKGRLQEAVSEFKLPTEIYPFTEDDVHALARQSKSPRAFYQNVLRQLEAWMDDVPPPAPPAPQATPEQIDKVLRDNFLKYTQEFLHGRMAKLPPEREFVNHLRKIMEMAFASAEERVTIGTLPQSSGVLPPNLVLADESGRRFCVALSNVEGNSLAAHVRNFVPQVLDDGAMTAMLLRDQRARDAVGVTYDLLEDFRRKNHCYHLMSRTEFGLINAVYRLVVDIEEHDLTIGQYSINKRDLVRFLKQEPSVRQTQFVKLMAARFAPLGRALDITSGAARGAVSSVSKG